MSTITTADVRAYIAKRHDAAAANATINRERAALKRMFALALQASKLLYRPHIPMLRENNVRTGFSSGGISKRSESTCRRHCGPS